ncbi:hypothetical protein LUZ60_000664 [Juncus effusus]|nr:hypothetical protein LUZ60_000664 [Juncus effusus]
MAPPIPVQFRTGRPAVPFPAMAGQLFDKTPNRYEFSYTTLMKTHLRSLDPFSALSLFSHIRLSDPSSLSPLLLSLALKSSASDPSLFPNGPILHSLSIKSASITTVFASTAIVNMYSKIGQTCSALQLFDEMQDKNVVTYTTVITALVRSSRYREALHLFIKMRESDLGYDSHAYAITLKACSNAGLLKQGREIHAQVSKLGFDTSPFVANTLGSMYAKFGFVSYSTRVLNRMSSLDVTAWTTIITSYVKTDQIDQAIKSFIEMQEVNHVRPNEYTYASIISACNGVLSIKFGEQLHSQVICKGFSKSQSVANSLVTMYSRAGFIFHADMAFNEMSIKDVVSWTAIISGYSQQGLSKEAFRLFFNMCSNNNNARPNEFTLASLLSLCANSALLETSRQLHGFAIVTGIAYNSTVVSALIDMYCKNGCIKEAESVFFNPKSHDLVSYTALICGYANNGLGFDAIKLFDEMPNVGLKPDKVAFIGVLTACCHIGNVELGFKYFESMRKDYGLEPVKEHYGCVVNLLVSVGRVKEAKEIVEKMPSRERDGILWTNLIRVCSERGEMEQVVQFEIDDAGPHVAVANMYASKGMWSEALEERETMREKGLVKEAGWSLNLL